MIQGSFWAAQAQDAPGAGATGFFLQPQHIEMDMAAEDATAHVGLGQGMLPMAEHAATPVTPDAAQNGAAYADPGGLNGMAANGGSMDHRMGYGSEGSSHNDEDSDSCHSGDSDVSSAHKTPKFGQSARSSFSCVPRMKWHLNFLVVHQPSLMTIRQDSSLLPTQRLHCDC